MKIQCKILLLLFAACLLIDTATSTSSLKLKRSSTSKFTGIGNGYILVTDDEAYQDPFFGTFEFIKEEDQKETGDRICKGTFNIKLKETIHDGQNKLKFHNKDNNSFFCLEVLFGYNLQIESEERKSNFLEDSDIAKTKQKFDQLMKNIITNEFKEQVDGLVNKKDYEKLFKNVETSLLNKINQINDYVKIEAETTMIQAANPHLANVYFKEEEKKNVEELKHFLQSIKNLSIKCDELFNTIYKPKADLKNLLQKLAETYNNIEKFLKLTKPLKNEKNHLTEISSSLREIKNLLDEILNAPSNNNFNYFKFISETKSVYLMLPNKGTLVEKYKVLYYLSKNEMYIPSGY